MTYEDQPPTRGSSTDASLLVRFRAGEDDAATALYTRYAQRLLQLASRGTGDDLSIRVDAEDIVQSVFRTFFRRVSDGHYQIPEGEELWKLFLVIALNKVRAIAEYHRAAKRDVGHTRSLVHYQLEEPADTSEVLRMTIDDVLATLPEQHQEVVRDRIDGYEIADIATRVSISRRSVERILQSFRARLRKTLDIK
jgi:RNA polymerase sigma-70 factor (ECF subfamily)